jgi:hypothetical protein
MKVTPTNDGRSFNVTSTDDKDHYVVDIMENEGRGVCSCADFRCRCQPRLNRGDRAIPYRNTHIRTQCKHIERVIEYLGVMLWSKLNNKQPTDLFEL